MKKNILTIILLILLTLILSIGLSFAYFTANIEGEETTSITVTGGSMNITYNGGSNISLNSILPSNSPAATKTFTVKGNNTTTEEMYYELTLVVSSNTFSENALKYKLISTNTNNNGKVAPSITDLTNIGAGAKIINLGIGNFASPTSGDKTHTYNLEIYFPSFETNQNTDQGRKIKAHVEIKNAKTLKLEEAILAQDGGRVSIEAKGTPAFNVINGTSGLYAAEDEYGTSYYYRGKKSELNNNIIWGGFQWKIVRINGDGSVRLIYNGTEAQFNSANKMNDTGSNTQIKTAAWNTNWNDAKYLGYMYGGANGVASTVRHGTTSAAATYNETKSNIKTELDNWYASNIAGKSFEADIVDNLFCNDRQLQSEVGEDETGSGYGTSETLYAAYYRLDTNKSPTLKCGLKNDRFTKNDTTIGNGALTYPIGLISADETSMAGFVFHKSNNTNYLYTNQYYWLGSPLYIVGAGDAYSFSVSSAGSLYDGDVGAPYGLRGAVSIDSKARVTGTGSDVDPYKVV
ncbi:MAG: hypothetical protein PHF21_01170 [Bacilli bacterium]|nr:hypothetical protein [Bacilli bacterium]